MDILKKLNRSSIRATDIASQYWCERQMELNCTVGGKITREIRKGRALHQEMENEVNVQFELNPRAYADVVYKILFTSLSALDGLAKSGKAREVQVYGSVNGFKLVGKIDQLELRDGTIVVWEDKTKRSNSTPSEAQLLTNRVQVMVYRKMLQDIREGRYSAAQYRKEYSTAFMKITPEFARQLDALSVAKELQSVDAIAEKYFDRLKGLGEISADLKVHYIDQESGQDIATYDFRYDDAEMGDMLEFIMKYWSGERESLPVPKDEMWKCKFCAFYGKECKVWWPQKGL